MKSINATCIGALLLAFASAAYASIDAGRVQFVHGDSRALGANGVERALKKGDPVYEGETVITGPSASLQLRMVDDAMVAVRPNSRLQIEVYRLDGKAEGEGHGVLRLISGTFRSITGLIGHTKKANYKIITDTANIGIRGTDHEPGYLLPSQAAAGAPGTYDMVNSGGTYIATPWGRVDVSPNQVGFASSKPGSVPVLLEGVPGFLRATPPMGQDADASGSDQPERIVGLGFDNPASLEEPWLDSLALSYLIDPTVVTTDLTTSDVATAMSFTVAGVYSDVTGGVVRKGVFEANPVPFEQLTAGTAGALAATDPNSKLIYTRGPAPMVANGSGTLADGTVVNWGIYGTGSPLNGHAIQDQYSKAPGRQPDYMQVMGALATPDAVVNTLKADYLNTVAFTPVISTTGGTSTADMGSTVTGKISIDSGSLAYYSVTATLSGAGGTWSGSCTSCGSLVAFKTSGVNLTTATSPTGPASGQAIGQVVGPTGAGAISSYSLSNGTTDITGSFAVGK
jgi:hypothetical protein